MWSPSTSIRPLTAITLAVGLSVVGVIGVIALDIDIFANDPDADAIVADRMADWGLRLRLGAAIDRPV